MDFMTTKCFIFVLLLAAISSLGAQENYNNEDFFSDEYPVMEGEGITIVGSKNTTQQMEIVDRETIEKINAPDLPALLEETLGLGVNRYGPYGNQAGVNIRGFDSKRVALLVDGVPVNFVSSGGFDFYSVDPSSLERIEVIHGGSDTKYNISGALGGVINFITVKKQKPGWSMGGAFSNTSYIPGKYHKQHGGIENPQWQDLADTQSINTFGAYGAEKFSFKLNLFGNRAGNHFLYQGQFGETRRKEGNEILDGGASVSFTRELGDFANLIATGSFYYGDKNIPKMSYIAEYDKQKDTTVTGSVMLDMPRAFHDDFAMEAALSYNWKRLKSEENSLHNEHNLNVINRWSWFPAEKFTLRFGGDFRFINLDSANSGLHNANHGGLYLTPEFSPVKNLLLIASIKGVINGGEIAAIPKLGLSWKINENLVLKNNYFRSFKFPDFDDLYSQESGFSGNPDLKNEDGWGADLGAELSVKERFDFKTTVYGQWTKDSIHWTPVAGMWKPENSGSAAFIGWDNKINLVLPFSFWILEKPILSISWIFQLSWLLSGDLTIKDKRRIPYMPMHTAGVSIEVPWKAGKSKLAGSLIISGHFESLRYVNTQNNAKLDPVFLLNIIYNQKLSKNISIFGKINNALNTHYFSYIDYPMPGISFTIGLRTEFGTKKQEGQNE
jgi:vitamin B12 transporter